MLGASCGVRGASARCKVPSAGCQCRVLGALGWVPRAGCSARVVAGRVERRRRTADGTEKDESALGSNGARSRATGSERHEPWPDGRTPSSLSSPEPANAPHSAGATRVLGASLRMARWARGSNPGGRSARFRGATPRRPRLGHTTRSAYVLNARLRAAKPRAERPALSSVTRRQRARGPGPDGACIRSRWRFSGSL